jgi:hypothetical protein
MIASHPSAALLELITSSGRARCATILEQAQGQARERVRNAFREARRRVARAISGERLRARSLLASHEARLETQDRQRYQDVCSTCWRAPVTAWMPRSWRAGRRPTAAANGWSTCWTRPAATARDDLGHRASGRLGYHRTRPWQDAIRTLSGSVPQLRVDPALRAGVRIQAGGACLDGSLEGCWPTKAIQAQLLARLEAALPGTKTGESS